MEKIDLKKELKYLYSPSAKKVEIVDVPCFKFIMIDGKIEPGKTPETSREFQDAIDALYGVSYTIKFMSKLREMNPIYYTVMALEGLWWTDSVYFDINKKDEWKWTMMIMQPDHITGGMYEEALQQLKAKKDKPAISGIRFESFHEGISMQIMHIGPYSEEPRNIKKMMAFAQENGYTPCGKHHEIYLGDPRRARPERLKTILRHPVEKRN